MSKFFEKKTSLAALIAMLVTAGCSKSEPANPAAIAPSSTNHATQVTQTKYDALLAQGVFPARDEAEKKFTLNPKQLATYERLMQSAQNLLKENNTPAEYSAAHAQLIKELKAANALGKADRTAILGSFMCEQARHGGYGIGPASSALVYTKSSEIQYIIKNAPNGASQPTVNFIDMVASAPPALRMPVWDSDMQGKLGRIVHKAGGKMPSEQAASPIHPKKTTASIGLH